MTVSITDEDVLDRLEDVEGRRWRYSDGGESRVLRMLDAYTGFLRMLEEEGIPLEEWRDDPPVLMVGDREIEPVLYGAEGYSRYVLRPDGELVLLGWSTRQEKLDLAQRQGFRVTGSSNPGRLSHRAKRTAAKARRFVMRPPGAFLIAGVATAAIGAIVWAARRGVVTLGPRQNPGPGRTAVIGDSIVANTAGFVRYLGQNVAGRTFENFGVVGQGTERILSDLRSRVIGHGFDEVIIEGGTNDLGRSNASDYITQRLRTMVQEAKAAGLKVVVLTMTPWRGAANLIPQINGITLSQARGWGADVVVDTYTPLVDVQGGLKGEYASPDGLHPTRAGQEVIGQTILSRAYA